MTRTVRLPSSAMRPPLRPDIQIQGLGWTQIPGTASQVAASPDSSLWVLSDQPAGPDKYIWHYVQGTWTNIPGLASQIAAGPNGYLYAVNSSGGTYIYNAGQANPAWSGLGGGARAVSVGQDGTVYVLSNGGGGPDYAIWQFSGGSWSQVPGSGVAIAGNWDWGVYLPNGVGVNPDGLYILNSQGSIYYENTDESFVQFPGSATAIAPITAGGFFVLGYPPSPNGETIYYNDMGTQVQNPTGWHAQPGSGVGISTDGAHLYVVSSSGGIYSTPVAPIVQSYPNPSLPNATGYLGWAPYQVASALQFPVLSGYGGSGETIAIVIDAVPAISDLQAYEGSFNIPFTGQISLRPVNGGAKPDAEGEATLDTETIVGLAPAANVVIYDIPAGDALDQADAYVAILSDGRASVVNMSYGGCEQTYDQSAVDPIFALGASEGVAFVASSGDTGNSCYSGPNTYPVGVSFPASDPNVIAVGGSETTYSNTGGGSITGPDLWNDCSGQTIGTNCMGSGGVSGNVANGFSGFPIPTYQQGLAGTSSSVYRNVPDITMPADKDEVVLGGSHYAVAGTSWGAPQVSALMAEMYQKCGVFGVMNPVGIFYAAFKAQGYAAFLDVTSGNNAYFGATPSFNAASGYDNASGIGIPLGMKVAPYTCSGVQISSRAELHLVESRLPAVARRVDNVVRLGGVTALGERPSASPTRIAVVLRPTVTLHADEQTVVDRLRAAGFTIVRRFRVPILIDASAPAGTVARYFNTRFGNFQDGRWGTRYANTTPITIPADIAPYVSGVLTDDLVTAVTPRAIGSRMREGNP